MNVTYQEDDIQSAIHEFCVEILNKQCLLNTEYKNAGVDCVTLCHADSKDDVAQLLLAEGWLLVESRREKRLAKLVGQYQKAQEKAKEGRVSVRFIPSTLSGFTVVTLHTITHNTTILWLSWILSRTSG